MPSLGPFTISFPLPARLESASAAGYGLLAAMGAGIDHAYAQLERMAVTAGSQRPTMLPQARLGLAALLLNFAAPSQSHADEPDPEPAAPSEDAGEADGDYYWHLCRLEYEKAEQVASTESQRALARLWQAHFRGEDVDIGDLNLVVDESEHFWLGRLIASEITNGADPSLLDAHDKISFGVVSNWSLNIVDNQVDDALPFRRSIRGDKGAVPVTIAGKRPLLWFDTAAWVLALRPGMLAESTPVGRMIIFNSAGTPRRRPLAEVDITLADLRVKEAFAVRLRMRIGTVVYRGVRTIKGVLGWSVIGRLRWSIDLDQNTATLSTRSRAVRRNLWYAGEPVVRVTIDGKPALALLDTGSTDSKLTALGARRLGYALRWWGPSWRTVNGVISSRRLRRKATLDLEGAGIEVKFAHRAERTPQDGVCYDAILGFDMLQKHRTMVLDGPAGYVRFGPPRPEASEQE